MGDINVKFRAAQLGKDIENIGLDVEAELQAAIKDTANAAHALIISMAQAQLNSTRQDFLNGLTFEELGNNTYLITLEGKFANALDDGYTGFDVKTGMLNSEKIVGVGSRSGEPWVQRSTKDGHKFAHVPFEHKPFSKAPQGADLNEAIRKLTVTNRQGRAQKFTSIFKDGGGKALSGRVASVKSVEGFPDLAGLTKYQKVYKNEATGKDTVQSIYMTFRTVSEQGKSWMHPGFAGMHSFAEAEKFVEEQIDIILNELIK